MNLTKSITLFLSIISFHGYSQEHPIFSEYGEGSSFNKWVEYITRATKILILIIIDIIFVGTDVTT